MFPEAKIGVDIVPVFISVDPERDTVEQVHEYVKGTVLDWISQAIVKKALLKIVANASRNCVAKLICFALSFTDPEFHPNLIGLTGNPDEVRKAARAYRVYYMKTEEEGSDYLVDHSIMMCVLPSCVFLAENFIII